MRQSKLLKKGPVPFKLKKSDGAITQAFCVDKYEQQGDEVLLYYKVAEKKGTMINVDDETISKKIPELIEVESGNWDGEKGRWFPLEYHFGIISCKGVTSCKVVSEKGRDFIFDLKKPFFSKQLKLLIVSKALGEIQITCDSVTPIEYTTHLFAKESNKWIPRKEILNQLSIED